MTVQGFVRRVKRSAMPSEALHGFNRRFAGRGGALLQVVIGLALLVALRSEGHLDDVAGHWTSVEISKNLTGDIDVSSTGIRFQNGKTIQLEYVRDRSDLGLHIQGSPPLREFRIVNPDGLILLQGQGLCGIPSRKKATYLAMYASELTPFLLARLGLRPDAKYEGLFVHTYFGSHEPKPWPDGYCLGLAYTRPERSATQSSPTARLDWYSSLGPVLKSLRWGMPEDEVKRVLPNFVSSVDIPDAPGNPGAQSIPGTTSVIKRYYPYRGCTFSLSLSFIQGRLSGINFVGLSAAACGPDIAKELDETFDARASDAPPPGNSAPTLSRLGNKTTSVIFSHSAGGVILLLSPVSRNEITEGTSPVE